MKQPFALWLSVLWCFCSTMVLGADYYWVGGSGSWTSLNNWSSVPGGPANMIQIPTPADRVFFTAASFTAPNQTVSMPSSGISCGDISFSGITQPMVLQGSGPITVFGGFELHALVNLQWTGELRLAGNHTTRPIHLAGKVLPTHVRIQGNGSWRLTDSLSMQGILYHENGGLHTAGFSVRCRYYESTDSTVRTLNLSTSTFYTFAAGYSGFIVRGRNMTLSADSSRLVFTTGGWFATNDFNYPLRFGFVEFEQAGNVLNLFIWGVPLNTYGYRFKRLKFHENGNIGATSAFDTLQLSAGYTYDFNSIDTIYQLLEMPATCSRNIGLIGSHGTPSGLYFLNGNQTFQHISLFRMQAGGGGTYTINNGIDQGNNSGWNIVAPLARTLFWVGGSGDWADGQHWSLSSGGAPSGCPPIELDSVVFDLLSFPAGNHTLSVQTAPARCSGLRWDQLGAGRNVTVSGSHDFYVHGSLLLPAGLIWDLPHIIRLRSNRAYNQLRSSGVTLRNAVNVEGTGTYYLLDSLRVFGGIDVNSGGLVTQGNNLSFFHFSSIGNNTRLIDWRNSQISTWGGNEASSIGGGNLQFLHDNSVFTMPGQYVHVGSSNDVGTISYGHVRLTNPQANAYIHAIDSIHFERLELAGNARFGTLWNLYTPRYRVDTLLLHESRDYEMLAACTLFVSDSADFYANCGGPISFRSSSPGQPVFIRKNGSPLYGHQLQLRDVHSLGTASFYAANSTNLGGNSGWLFSQPAARRVYWVGGSGSWHDASHWSLSAGGVGGACVPTSADSVYFTAASFGTGDTLRINLPAFCAYFEASSNSQSARWEGIGQLEVLGSLVLRRQQTIAWQGELRLKGNQPIHELRSSGTRWMNTVRIDGSGTYLLTDSLQTNGSLFVDRGGLQSQNQPISAASLIARGTASRSLLLGNSSIYLNGQPAWCWLDSSNLQLQAANSQMHLRGQQQSLRGMGGQQLGKVYFETAGSNDTIVAAPNLRIQTLHLRGNTRIEQKLRTDSLLIFPGSSQLLPASDTVFINQLLQAQGINCLPINIASNQQGSSARLHKATDTVALEFVLLRDIHALGGGAFYAGGLSTNLGGNNGWSFTAKPGTTYGFATDSLGICPGDTLRADNFVGALSYLWQSGESTSWKVPSSTGWHWVTVNYGPSCNYTDSIHVTIFSNPVPNIQSAAVFCSADSLQLRVDSLAGARYEWQGPANRRWYDRQVDVPMPDSSYTGWYRVQRFTADSCVSRFDSIYIRIGYPSRDTLAYSLCAGDTFTSPLGGIYTQNGHYPDTFSSFASCDSVVVRHLQFVSAITHSRADTLCFGDTLTLPGGRRVSSTGTYTDTLVGAAATGCDSVVITLLHVRPASLLQQSVVRCANQWWVRPRGDSANTAGTYRDTLLAAAFAGCDSIIETQLQITPLLINTQNVSICEGAIYILPGGDTARNAATYRDTLAGGSNGCDSVVITQLQVIAYARDTVSYAICSGDSLRLARGYWIQTAGVYTDTLSGVAVAGCDSIIRQVVTVSQVYSQTQVLTRCVTNPYTLPGGGIASASGTYRDTLQSIAGCDSIIITHLTVIEVALDTLQPTICANQWYSRPGGSLVQTAGTYRDTLAGASFTGCDSVIVSLLNVLPIGDSLLQTSICRGDTFVSPGGTPLVAAGLHIDTLRNQAANGCDSIVRIQLQLLEHSFYSYDSSLCAGEILPLPGGGTATTSGIYRDTLQALAANGCDSIVETRLTVYPTYIDNIMADICAYESYQLPDGTQTATAGNYSFTLPSVHGCDSVVNINLRVHPQPPTPAAFDTTICFSIPFTLAHPDGLIPDLVWYASDDSLSIPVSIGPLLNYRTRFDSLMLFIANRSPQGCESGRSQVRLYNDGNEPVVYLPNAFTPNADGINDRWAPVGDAWFSLNIYDRWGNLLHQQQGTTVGWDGLDYPQGVYAYSLSYSRCDGPIFHKGGHISLIR